MRTYQPLPATDDPMGIVINRGPREPDRVEHPRVRAYVWAPAPDEFDSALAAEPQLVAASRTVPASDDASPDAVG
ncbi:MAG: hypothetical protein ACK6DK_14690 [Gemmatimonadota bacterium]